VAELKRLTIDQLKLHRSFHRVISNLKLANSFPTLKESVNFCERLGYCRYYDLNDQKTCIHR
jgi:hypothetical protein